MKIKQKKPEEVDSTNHSGDTVPMSEKKEAGLDRQKISLKCSSWKVQPEQRGIFRPKPFEGRVLCPTEIGLS